MIKTFLLLSVLGLTYGRPQEECPPGERILLAHESDCSKYHMCLFGKKSIQALNCPVNSLFSYEKQNCVQPSESECFSKSLNSIKSSNADLSKQSVSNDCQNAGSACSPAEVPVENPGGCHGSEPLGCECPPGGEDPPTNPDPPSNPDPPEVIWLENGCPSDSTYVNKLLPHDYCAMFYQCVHGEKVEMLCAPSGTHFSYDLQRCDWPDRVNCSGEIGAPPGEDNPPIEGGVPVEVDPDDVIWLENGCPSDSTNINKLLPHPDCTKFYQCVHGDKIEMDCAGNGLLHFSYELQRCEWPSIANCTPGEIEPDPEPPAPPCCSCCENPPCNGTNPNPPCNGTETEPAPPCENPPCNGTDTDPPYPNPPCNGTDTKPPCPNPPCENDIIWLPNGCPANYSIEKLLPHEECDRYYRCVKGELIEIPCECDLQFSYELQRCDVPEIAQCVQEDANDKKCKDNCHVPFWRDDTDCDKFWRCEDDKAVQGVCSEGLFFNEKKQSCDFMCNVDCHRKVTQSTARRDGLNLFLPWNRVDSLLGLSKRVDSHIKTHSIVLSSL